tara:strand:- start:1228 stop:1899 length:672 start_codon:yes stop_codon:yes gene_type:complete
MKAFLIFVKDHLQSTNQAARALSSCKDTRWDVELMEGITPLTVDKYDMWTHCPGSRASNFFEQNEKKYKTKKSCFMNHVKVWEKCIELDEPVAFLEHDVGCVRDYIEEDFEDVLILNIESAMKQEVFNDISFKGEWDLGIHEYEYQPLAYRHNVSEWKGSYMMPGTGAYAVTPKGAKKLLDSVLTYGWEQSDFFINTANVTIQYIVPEYFTFKSKNLNMSHGW